MYDVWCIKNASHRFGKIMVSLSTEKIIIFVYAFHVKNNPFQLWNAIYFAIERNSCIRIIIMVNKALKIAAIKFYDDFHVFPAEIRCNFLFFFFSFLKKVSNIKMPFEFETRMRFQIQSTTCGVTVYSCLTLYLTKSMDHFAQNGHVARWVA